MSLSYCSSLSLTNNKNKQDTIQHPVGKKHSVQQAQQTVTKKFSSSPKAKSRSAPNNVTPQSNNRTPSHFNQQALSVKIPSLNKYYDIIDNIIIQLPTTTQTNIMILLIIS